MKKDDIDGIKEELETKIQKDSQKNNDKFKQIVDRSNEDKKSVIDDYFDTIDTLRSLYNKYGIVVNTNEAFPEGLIKLNEDQYTKLKDKITYTSKDKRNSLDNIILNSMKTRAKNWSQIDLGKIDIDCGDNIMLAFQQKFKPRLLKGRAVKKPIVEKPVEGSKVESQQEAKVESKDSGENKAKNSICISSKKDIDLTDNKKIDLNDGKNIKKDFNLLIKQNNENKKDIKIDEYLSPR